LGLPGDLGRWIHGVLRVRRAHQEKQGLRIKLLRSSTSEDSQLQVLTTFLVNDCLAIDGGSVGLALSLPEMQAIRDIVITHVHIDHIASLPIFLAEAFTELKAPVTVYALPEVVSALRDFIFNDQIWPNFENIPLTSGTRPTLEFRTITPRAPFEINGIRVTAARVNHVVPTVGLRVQDLETAVIFTSDTYITDEIWEVARETEHLKAIFVDVSYPNEMESLAAASKHLTPQTLASELIKLKQVVEVYATHIKPGNREQVVRQLGELKSPPVSIAEIGRAYEW
jgi:ribonuclease BN (tRNA processing enzyme)